MIREGTDYTLSLRNDEMVRTELPGGTVTIYVRYVPASAAPIFAPMFDLTISEITGLAMAVIISALLALFVSVALPTDEERALVELAQPKRQAQFIYKPTLPPPPPPRKIEKQAKLPPIALKDSKKKEDVKRKKKTVGSKVAKKSGRASRIRPKNLPKAPKKLTSLRKGGSKKLSKKAGASAATKEKDVSQLGVLGVFGNAGYRDKLDKASSGVGVLQGLAEKATGGVGEDEDLIGDGIGRALKDTGAGGDGLSTIGLANVNTKGRGSGDRGYGRGGIGEKKRINIQLSGEDAEFIGKIDKEAIRRVIKSNERQVRACYEAALNRQPDLKGRLLLRWKIGDLGKVYEASVKESSLGSTAVANCVLRRLRTWRFPEPPPGVEGEVEYPFVFVSQN